MTATQGQLDVGPHRHTSTAAEWTAGRRAEIDRLEQRLDAQHHTLSVPVNPAVTVGADWQDHLRITVGTARRIDRTVTGRRLTAVFGETLKVWDTTASLQLVDDIAPGKFGLTRRSTAQQVIDQLAKIIGPHQCQVCGTPGDHLCGVDERPYCASCRPDHSTERS